MGSLINVTNVLVLDNPTKFTNPFQLEITFECLEPGLKEELEWKLIYVGSAEDERYDQELDSVLVGPISLGKNKFVFQVPPPDIKQIPEKDLLEVTVILLICCYKDKEFIRIGYYVNNDYGGERIPDAILSRYTRQYQQATAEEASTDADAEEEAEMAAGDDEKEGEEEEEEEGEDEMDQGEQENDEKKSVPSSAQVTASLQSMTAPTFSFSSSPFTSTSTSTATSTSTSPSSSITGPTIDINKLHRNILSDKPRVTRFQIPWDQEVPATTATTTVAPSEVSLQSESDLGFASGRPITSNTPADKQTHLSLPNDVPYEENSIDMMDD